MSSEFVADGELEVVANGNGSRSTRKNAETRKLTIRLATTTTFLPRCVSGV